MHRLVAVTLYLASSATAFTLTLPRSKVPSQCQAARNADEEVLVRRQATRRPQDIERRNLLATWTASAGLLAAGQQANAASPATPVQETKAAQTATGKAFAITEDMSGRIAFITGGDTGLGFECATQLAKAGATVVIGCSDATNGEAAAAKIREVTGSQTDCACLPLDLGSIASVKKCVKQFLAKYPELHILINNAEVTASAERSLTTDQLEYTMGVNHLGHFALTAGLLDRLRRSHGGVRVINLASTAAVSDATGLDLFEDLRHFSSPDDDDGCAQYSPRSAFCKSKLANVLFTVELQRRLDEAPVLALNAGASPGLPGGYGSVTVAAANAERGALTPLYLAASATLPQGTRGGYFEEPGRLTALANPAASDGALATALWDASEAATGVSFNLAAYQNLSNRIPTLPQWLPNGDFDVAYPHDIWPASHMQKEVKLLLNPSACDEFTDRDGACTEEGWVAIETAQ